MGFGGQMHHRAWFMVGEYPRERGRIADIRLFKDVARLIARRAQRFQIAGIGELVDVDHGLVSLGNILANHCRSDKAGAACNDESHVISRCCAIEWGINTAGNVNVKRITTNKMANLSKPACNKGKLKAFFTQI